MLQRVERHIVTKADKNWKCCDQLCFFSKNLYNAALFAIRKHYEETGKHLAYIDTQKHFQNLEHIDYRMLSAATAQQILMIIDKAFKSYFSALCAYRRSTARFIAAPKPPQYKNSSNGRNITVFTYGNQITIKNGFLHFPKKSGLLPIKTKQTNIQQVRIVPQSSCYVIEVVYKKEAQFDENLKESNVLAIDLGVNNLAAVVSNQPGIAPILISGKALKSMNQYYNKKLASLKSRLPKNAESSVRIKRLHLRRNCKVSNFLHHASKTIIEFAKVSGSKTIVIGYNEGWKQEINIGKRNNQKFVYIPFRTLISQIVYKAEEIGIGVVLHEEAFTSKCSALDLEPCCKRATYIGKRVKRGLFKSVSSLINADINGALNIGRKVFGDEFIPADRGCIQNPVGIDCLRSFSL